MRKQAGKLSVVVGLLGGSRRAVVNCGSVRQTAKLVVNCLGVADLLVQVDPS